MPVKASQFTPFKPTVEHVLHYLPKIAAAVGRNSDLLLPIFTEEVISGRNNVLANQLAEKIAKSELKIDKKDRTCLVAKAKKILKGFVKWLDDKKYTYNSRSGDLLTDRVSYTEWEDKYNLFYHPSAPIGDCRMTANAFALLLAMNGFPCKELMLVGLQTKNGTEFVFRGGKKIPGVCMVDPIDPRALAPMVRFGRGKGLERVPATDADSPFMNHWVVKYKENYYDANYRAIYQDPENLFAETFGHVMYGNDGAPMNREFLLNGRVSCSFKALNKIFFLLDEPASLLSKACPSLSNKHTNIYLVGEHKAEEVGDVVMLEGQQVSHKHARLFGWCVPDDTVAIKNRLMKAVEAYDKSVTGKIFRISTDKSKEFCRKSRKWCGKTDLNNNQALSSNRIYGGVNWAHIEVWPDDATAKNAIYNAMKSNSVGTTLRRNLCDAFELPDYLRTT